jgi:hypothetical protein
MIPRLLTFLCAISIQEKRNSNYCETTDKDSSDEHSTTSSISTKVRSRGLHEKGYVYYLVKQDTWEHCWVRENIDKVWVRLGLLLDCSYQSEKNMLISFTCNCRVGGGGVGCVGGRGGGA